VATAPALGETQEALLSGAAGSPALLCTLGGAASGSAASVGSPRRNLHTDRHAMIVMMTALDAHSSQMA
jgi:hypothetical protein